MIMPNAVLRNVLFTNFRCGDALRADSSSIYERVTFVGRYPNRLIFRPDDWDRYVMPDETGIDYHFDIRDFKGEVELVGFRGKKVLKDPSRHVTIKAAWMNEVDWSGLGIQKLGLFRICARKLSGSKAEEEVFSLPKLTEKRYEQEMQDYERLKAAGVQFD